MKRTLLRRRRAAVAGVLLCSWCRARRRRPARRVRPGRGPRGHRLPVPWPQLALCAGLTLAEVLLDAAVALLGGTTTARLTVWARSTALERVLGTEPATVKPSPRRPDHPPDRQRGRRRLLPVTAASSAAAVLPLGGVTGLFLVDVWAGAAFVLGAPAIIALLWAFTRRTADTTADYQSRQAELATRLTEALDGAATIRAAHTGAREYARVLEPWPRSVRRGAVPGRSTGAPPVAAPCSCRSSPPSSWPWPGCGCPRGAQRRRPRRRLPLRHPRRRARFADRRAGHSHAATRRPPGWTRCCGCRPCRTATPNSRPTGGERWSCAAWTSPARSGRCCAR
ncbi:hypothetical protein NKH77_40225 [Streptomyces sp. M19]